MCPVAWLQVSLRFLLIMAFMSPSDIFGNAPFQDARDSGIDKPTWAPQLQEACMLYASFLRVCRPVCLCRRLREETLQDGSSLICACLKTLIREARN